MPEYLIIENEQVVDLATSREELQIRLRNGWAVVENCLLADYEIAVHQARKYAQDHGKRCNLHNPISKKEMGRRLYGVYETLLGRELWAALGELFQQDPDKALELGMQALEKVLGPRESKPSVINQE
jgi:hypothetical protein